MKTLCSLTAGCLFASNLETVLRRHAIILAQGFQRPTVQTMANGIGPGAREIISLGVDKGSKRAAQRRDANTGFQKRANFLKEPDSKGSDRIALPSR